MSEVISRHLLRKLDAMGLATPQRLDALCIAGGAVPSLLRGDQPKDYDVFFNNPTVLSDWLREQITLPFPATIQQDEVNPRLSRLELPEGFDYARYNDKQQRASAKVRYVSPNSISLANGVQIILRFIGQPEDLFTTFDYEHCKVCWTPLAESPLTGRIEYHGESQKALAKNQLLYRGGSRFQLSAMLRAAKFVKRGWSLPASTLLSLAKGIKQLDLANPEVLHAELQGIYGLSPEQKQWVINKSTENGVVDLDKVVTLLEEFD